MSTTLLGLHLPLLDSLAQTRDQRPLRKGERQRIFSSVEAHSVRPCLNLSAVSNNLLLHISAALRRRGMTVPRNSFTRYYRQFLRISFINQLYRRVRRPRRTACHPSAPCIPVGAVIDRPHNAKSLPNSYLLTPTSYLAYALHSQLSTLHSTAHKKNPKLSFRVLLSYSSSNAPV